MTGLDYRLPENPVLPGEAYDEYDFAVITDMPIKSLITAPTQDFVVSVGSPFEIRGFAWSGHTPVASVSVLLDGEAAGTEANLEPAPDRFAWRRFRALVQVDRAGPFAISSRAVDGLGRSQPVEGALWNPRGYCNNAVYRVSGLARTTGRPNH